MTRGPLLYALGAALANVAGAAAVTYRRRQSARVLELILALSAGFMISVAMLDLLPEAIARGGQRAAGIAFVGYLLVHFTQHTIARHFHFGEETHEVSAAVSASALVGLLLHTLVDGVAIASSFAVSSSLGTLVFIAIFLHKFPEGLAISSLFLAAGAGRRNALFAAGALGVATLVGVVLTAAVPALSRDGLALAGGVTLYVAASNLVPETQRKGGLPTAGAFFLGCGLYVAARSIAGL